VLALSLEARWVARALAAPELPLVATGVTLYALYLVLVVAIGRVGRTEFSFPVTATAAGANIGLNLALVPPHGLVGAGIALVGSYLVMLVLMYLVTRRYFPVPFQWGRLARIVGIAAALFAVGELTLPTAGAGGFLLRAALVPLLGLLLYASGFFQAEELRYMRRLGERLRARSDLSAEAPQDLEALQRRTELMEDMHET
jgi:O-antigen/teichoic acid export membrane protein